MSDKENEEPDPPVLGEGSFEEIDERMVVISSRSWIGFAALGLVFVAIMAWAFLGSVTLYVEGRGISLTRGGVLNIPSRLNGRVVEIYVEKGQQVKEGTPIAQIYDYEREINLETTEEKMKVLEKDLKAARQTAEIEDASRKEGIMKNIEALDFSTKKRKEQLPFLKKDVEAKNRLYKEGLVSASQREQAERNLMEEYIRIEELQAKIASLYSDLKRGYKLEELKSYERMYRDAQVDLTRLKAKSISEEVVSPFEGLVLEVQVRRGEEVKEGQPLAWLEKPKTAPEDMSFYCFVPADQGDKVKVGMSAILQLFNVNPEKQGYLMGIVKEVSKFPVTGQYVFSLVQSKELVEFLSENQAALIEVVVTPLADPHSLSGYKWTSGKGPQIEIHSGLLSYIKIAIEKRRPISYVFPQWWLPEGLEE